MAQEQPDLRAVDPQSRIFQCSAADPVRPGIRLVQHGSVRHLHSERLLRSWPRPSTSHEAEPTFRKRHAFDPVRFRVHARASGDKRRNGAFSSATLRPGADWLSDCHHRLFPFPQAHAAHRRADLGGALHGAYSCRQRGDHDRRVVLAPGFLRLLLSLPGAGQNAMWNCVPPSFPQASASQGGAIARKIRK